MIYLFINYLLHISHYSTSIDKHVESQTYDKKRPMISSIYSQGYCGVDFIVGIYKILLF